MRNRSDIPALLLVHVPAVLEQGFQPLRLRAVPLPKAVPMSENDSPEEAALEWQDIAQELGIDLTDLWNDLFGPEA